MQHANDDELDESDDESDQDQTCNLTPVSSLLKMAATSLSGNVSKRLLHSMIIDAYAAHQRLSLAAALRLQSFDACQRLQDRTENIE